ncbi:MAG: excinuclease ABC subunit UvrC [Deltaproteobacteria bacterium]
MSESHSVLNRDYLAGVSELPGVYIMRDSSGTILYVGKARNLRKRLSSYVIGQRRQSPKTLLLLSRVNAVETIITNTEKEALLLEAALIKKHKPRFNISLRDDKNYPYLKVTVQEEWPRVMMSRKASRDGARYFGPYSSAGAMWQTLHFLNKAFPLRLCKKPHLVKRSRPCLNYQIGRCLAPCAGLADPHQYAENVKNVLLLLEGRNEQLVAELEKKMHQASAQLHFEKAAEYRDRIASLRATLEKQVVNTGSGRDQDVFALVREGSLVVISLLMVRRGVIETRRDFSFTEPVGDDHLVMGEFISRYYADDKPLPHEIILSVNPEDQEMLREWLSEKSGRKVSFSAAARGIPRKLLAMAQKNAQQAIRDSLDKDKAWQLLAENMRRTLHLTRSPERIECLDISNLGGQQSVGSLICFEHGKKASTRYRSFKIKTVEGADDYASMAEVLRRRFAEGKDERQYPDLLLVDGGRGQLNVAVQVFAERGLADRIDLVAIAKGREEGEVDRLFVPNRKNPFIFKGHSPILLYCMQVRDEAHRYGITLHRKLQRKKSMRSTLDDMPDIGEKRKKMLLDQFGSVARLSRASVDDLCKVEGIGAVLAVRIYEFFHAAAKGR